MACHKSAPSSSCCTLGSWLTLYLTATLLILLTDKTGMSEAHVKQVNDYVMLTTRDSGTFIGIKGVKGPRDLHRVPSEDEFRNPSSLILNSGSQEGPDYNSSITANGPIYYAFRGIPYARAPLGPLRWKDPQPLEASQGPRDATNFKSICPQYDPVSQKPVGSPDCLHLNIFTPRLHFERKPSVESSSPYDDDSRLHLRLLPVLVYIHDQDHELNSGNFWGHEKFMKSQDVVLVTLNFRLGVLGFLSAGNKVLPGNLGLLDQIASLKWLRLNIHRFGGDPERLTIFGDVFPLLVSPLSSNLFSGGILMTSASGSPYNFEYLQGDPVQNFRALVQGLDYCHIPIPDQIDPHDLDLTRVLIEDCLDLKPMAELIQIQERLFPRGLRPVIDGPFSEHGGVFPSNFTHLLAQEDVPRTKVPIMIGMNVNEGFLPFMEFARSSGLFGQRGNVLLEETLKVKLQAHLKGIFPETLGHEVVSERVWEFYFESSFFNEQGNQRNLIGQLIKLFGDITVFTSHYQLLGALTRKSSEIPHIYVYVFDHLSEDAVKYLDQMDFGPTRDPLPMTFPWEEEFYLFNVTNPKNDGRGQGSDSEVVSETIMMKLWASFASYRNPKNAVKKFPNWSRWSRLGHSIDEKTKLDLSFYHLQPNSTCKMEKDFRIEEAIFWLEQIPELSLRVQSGIVLAGTSQLPWSWTTIGSFIIGAILILIILISLFICRRRQRSQKRRARYSY